MSQVKPVLNVANHWNIVPGNKPDFVVEVDSRSRLKNTLSDPSGATDLASQRNFSTSLNGWCAPPEVKLTLTFRITGNLNTGG